MWGLLFAFANLAGAHAACPKDGTLRTILWSAPRSGSSVFARSMMQHQDTVVHFERLFDSYYLGPENRSSNYYFEPEGMNVTTRTFQAIIDDFLAELPAGKKMLFAKEMAYYYVPANISDQNNFLWHSDLDCFQHTFLLRSPNAQVPSMAKVTSEEAELLRKAMEAAADYNVPAPAELDLDEIGVQQLHFLFRFVENRTGVTPVVVDINDLWKEPEKILTEYCEKIGLEFDPSMLSWEKGWREEFRYWDNGTEWMRDVFGSSGFLLEGSTQRSKKKSTFQLESAAQKAMEAAEPLYAEMFPVRIQGKSKCDANIGNVSYVDTIGCGKKGVDWSFCLEDVGSDKLQHVGAHI